MKGLVSPALLQGPALDHIVLEAIDDINKLGGLNIDPQAHIAPTENPALLHQLMDVLNIDLFWHEEYNGVEQSVVEADCTCAGPVREACEIDAVASDVMTAVYRAVVIYTYGNEVEVDESLLDTSVLETGILNGKEEAGSISIKERRSWMPWSEAGRFVGKKVLLRFSNDHIEDATLHLNDQGDVYYTLFDGDSLTIDVEALMLIPEQGWTSWTDCKKFIGDTVLIRFEGGHIEDAIIQEDVNHNLHFMLFDNNELSDTPVAATHIPNK